MLFLFISLRNGIFGPYLGVFPPKTLLLCNLGLVLERPKAESANGSQFPLRIVGDPAAAFLDRVKP